jgi:hypothetical protein
VGIKEVAEKIWLVTFMHYDLGFFDHWMSVDVYGRRPADIAAARDFDQVLALQRR